MPRKYNIEKEIKFNNPNGSLGLIAIDNTTEPSIRFCQPEEIQRHKIKKQSRSITRISTPIPVHIPYLNKRINHIRKTTHDTFLTAFKGLRKDGYYRRRIDFELAKRIIAEQIDAIVKDANYLSNPPPRKPEWTGWA